MVVSQNRKIDKKTYFATFVNKSVYLALLDYYLVNPVHLKESDKDMKLLY